MRYSIGIMALLVLFGGYYWYHTAHNETISGDFTKVKDPLVIFDFDGVICPSYSLFMGQVNALADEYKIKKVSQSQVEQFREMPLQAILKSLNVSMIKLPFILKRVKRNVQEQLLELKPVPGIVEVLQALQAEGISLGVLTSNSEKNVRSYFKRYGIDVFDFIYAGNNVFGKHKNLKKILKKTNLNLKQHQLIYIGDEIRDIQAAKKVLLANIGVTWGYNSKSFLEQSNPDFICEEPAALFSVVLNMLQAQKTKISINSSH